MQKKEKYLESTLQLMQILLLCRFHSDPLGLWVSEASIGNLMNSASQTYANGVNLISVCNGTFGKNVKLLVHLKKVLFDEFQVLYWNQLEPVKSN